MGLKPRIFFHKPHLTEAEFRSVQQTLKGGWIAPIGPEINAFEKRLREHFQYPNVLALNSGTSALHLAIKLSGVGVGDRVLVGSFSFIAAVNAILYEGGIPVLLDSESSSWNLDPDLLEDCLERLARDGKLPSAVIVTHIFGRAARMKRIVSVCEVYKVKVIEDAAEAIGTPIDEKFAGGYGDFGVLSFNGNKMITTGGGGALITRSTEDHERAAYLSNQSKSQQDHFHHEEVGYNYRMSNVLAGLGIAQLNRFEKIRQRKEDIHNFYYSNLKDIPWITLPNEGTKTNHWTTPLLIKPEKMDQANSSGLVKAFEKENIEVRRFWKPLHQQPLCAEMIVYNNGVSDDLFARGVCLPGGPGLTESELIRIVEVFHSLKS